MDLVAGAMGKLPSKLLELLKEEYNLQTGLKEKVMSSSRELERIHSVLRKVAEAQPDQLDELVLLWARDIREASYDMEDVLDTFLVRVDGAPQPADKDKVKRILKKMGNIFSLSKGKARHEIADAIEVLSKQLEDVAKLRGRYTVDSIVAKPAAATRIDPLLSALYTNASQLVGIDEQRDRLINILSFGDDGDEPTKETKIVSVVGFGGLGKTTLAKAVHDKLKVNFDEKGRSFVSVGRNPDLKKVFKDILIDLDKKRYTTEFNLAILDEKQLIDELREFLNNIRYFIVIDDVWDVSSWTKIRYALCDNKLGSKIIVTTRSRDIARSDVSCFSYEMEALSLESSKILFYGRIFGSEDKCPEQLLEVSKKILKKCGGVPLAIVTTSSLLANKSRNIEEWHEVCGSIGSGLDTNSHMDNMRKILSLSYYDLPPHLKTCLLYLSTFPEDYEIGRSRLIERWIAEDFILHQKGIQSLFEIGDGYFNELANRSLIQLVYSDNGTYMPVACRVHDMVLDLICSLARELNFVTILKDTEQNKSSESKKVRRLSLQNTTCPTTSMSQVRSLTAFSGDNIDLMPPLSDFNLLRVLDLEGCGLEGSSYMRFLGNLLHLRYLGLKGTWYDGSLPEEIGKLQFLQILDIRGTKIKELPSSIVGLKQLMSLYVDGRIVLPKGMRNLMSLQVLEKVAVTEHSAYILEELGHLTQLRVLVIIIKGSLEESALKALVESLGKLCKIQTLMIDGLGDMGADLMREGWVPPPCLRWIDLFGDMNDDVICTFTTLPTWIDPTSLLLLSHLFLKVHQMRREDIQLLGMMPSLLVLILRVSWEIRVEGRFMLSADAFPCLRTYSIIGFGILPSMFPQGAMPRLEKFHFTLRLRDFLSNGGDYDDLAIGHLPSLRQVDVWLQTPRVSDEVIDKVEEKLKHEADVHPNHPIEFKIHQYVADEEEEVERRRMSLMILTMNQRRRRMRSAPELDA